jgi:hypothetical protein
MTCFNVVSRVDMKRLEKMPAKRPTMERCISPMEPRAIPRDTTERHATTLHEYLGQIENKRDRHQHHIA